MLASTLAQAIGGLLPSAIGVALSPIPIIAVILMLGTPKARSNGPAFGVGWILGLSVVSTVVVLLANTAGDPADSSSSTSTSIGWGKVVLGVLLLSLAAKQWRARPKAGETPEMPKWMATVDHFGAPKAFVMGVLLSGVNPKNLILTAAAAASIAQVSGITGAQTVEAIIVFVVLGSVTVVGAVLFYLIGGSKSDHLLGEIKQFMSTHNAVIMMVIFLILGAKVLGDGLGGALGH